MCPTPPPSEGPAQSGLLDEGSTDEAETWHAPPTPYFQEAAAFVSTLNVYQHVRLADIERADITEQQGNNNTGDTRPTWPIESTPDHRPDNQYHWQADLTDSTYRYDKLVEPPGLAGREK